jgi:hypothetical protein
MKKIYLYFTLVLVLMSTGCEDFVEGYDESPNAPSEVTPSVLLTASEAAVTFFYTSQPARAASIFVQSAAGVTDQAKDQYQLYNLNENSVGNEWNGIYSDCLETTEYLIQNFGEESPYYRGMGKVIQALAMGMVTDYWGDVPYTEALKGLSGGEALNPGPDSQESILNSIQQLCDEAIADFQVDASENAFVPGADDILLNGDMSRWEMTAWLLKARYANRLSGKDATGSATDVLNFLDEAYSTGMTSNEQNFLGKTGESSTDLNQWKAFQETRGYMRAGGFLVDLMVAQDDPRLPYYFAEVDGGGYEGSHIGEDNASASQFGSWLMTQGQDFPLLTYFEAKFLEAEAALRASDPDRAATAYNAAVVASVNFFTGEEPDATFINNVASETAASIDLETIMTQKYIGMFTQPEAWADYRRTGYPNLSPEPRGAINQIPARYPTPLDERLYNPNMTSITNLTTPVWWAE